MNNNWLKYGLNFLLIVLIQGLVINNIQMSTYINPMVYPVLIMLLPFETGAIVSMTVALILGVSIDAFSNTFGLHTSSILLLGYIRPVILKYLRPKEGMDSGLLPSIHDMGMTWFLLYSSVMITVHHLWFFSFEIFRFGSIGFILGKTILSGVFSIALIILFQYIFYKSSKK